MTGVAIDRCLDLIEELAVGSGTGAPASARELCPSHVSSPRHIERSVRISRTALPHSLHVEAYGPILPGRLSASCIALDSCRTARECRTATAHSIAPSRSPFAFGHASDGA